MDTCIKNIACRAVHLRFFILDIFLLCHRNNNIVNLFWKELDFTKSQLENHQLRARRALSLFKDVLLRNRRALSLYYVYGDSALLVLNRTSLNSDSALLVLNKTSLNSDSALLALSWHNINSFWICYLLETWCVFIFDFLPLLDEVTKSLAEFDPFLCVFL